MLTLDRSLCKEVKPCNTCLGLGLKLSDILNKSVVFPRIGQHGPRINLCLYKWVHALLVQILCALPHPHLLQRSEPVIVSAEQSRPLTGNPVLQASWETSRSMCFRVADKLVVDDATSY